MVHSAYDSVQVVRGCPAKVEVAGVHGSKILTGCSDCSLRIYAPASPSSTASDTSGRSAPCEKELQREPYVLERTVSAFWKKNPVAMEVSRSRDLLLSLSEWIAFHRLPNLETVAAIGKTKGANVYSWDDQRGFLCVGRQKKVGIFRFDGGREFVEVKEFGVPDVVKSMAWCGENICLGIKREYMILNSSTGALSEVFPSGRIAPPLVTPLALGDLLLGKDNIGVFVDQNGKLLQDGRICWSEAPTSVIINRPYAIARLPKYVEIRSLRAPYPLVQTVYLRDVHILLQSNGCVIATSGNSVYGLLPVPIDVQIVQLTASGDFEEALALCKLLPPEDSALRAAKEGSIHIRYGHSLFDNGNYEEAVEQFIASQVDITYVLSLYPSIILPKTMAILEPDKLPDLSDSSFLSRASSDASDELDPSSPSQFVDSDEKSMLKEKKMNHNAFMGLTKYLQKKRYGIIERAIAEVTEEVVMGAVQAVHARGSHHISSVARERASILDTALLQAMLLTGQSTGALEFLKAPNYCDLKICEEFLLEKKHHAILLELYKGNEMHRDALKLLIQLVEESNSNSSDPMDHQKFMPDMVIEYLKPICGSDPILVLEFSMHVLESCPTQTIELFLSGNIPADLVNSYLKQHAPNMQSKYLELMLSMNESGVTPNLQNELVQIYLSEVLDWFKDLKDQQKWDEKVYSSTRKKLLSALEGILENSEHAVLLGRMNQHQLALSLYVHKLHLPNLALTYCDRVYEAELHRASSRGNSNIYLTLLQIYLNPRSSTKEFEQKTRNMLPPQSHGNQRVTPMKAKVGRVSKKIAAIEGAEDMRSSPSSTDSGRSDCDGDEVVEEGDPIMLNNALDLLSQRWDRINGAQALRLLPRKTKLLNLLPFLEPLLKKSSEGRRNYSIIRNLRYSENLQVKEELLSQQKQGLKIDGDSMCSLCRKKIGSSVFVVYPNRKTLVHFVCFRDSQRLRY
ncbi:unnamed protein product [Spirodela intermedia]|uniref:CNH domain-containing protein n=1 Tax=Spirodela intermedia TaxID=51605 RepID=A0A7I8IR65_SPIIN|nr:unnamed protein product [Spirodela intermedia]CAA6660293.1 unnamed protein product [Spirodela intermedia]